MSDTDTGLQLRRYVENIEKFEEDKKGISETISDAYKEAKAAGFDVATIKNLIKARKESEEERLEKASLMRLYAKEIGMQGELF